MDKQGNVKFFGATNSRMWAFTTNLLFVPRQGWLVWIHGPFPCGDRPDVCIFHNGLKNMLDEKECVEADDG